MTTAAEAVARWLRGDPIACIALDCEGGPDAIEDVIRAEMVCRSLGLTAAVEGIDTISKMHTEQYEKQWQAAWPEDPWTLGYRTGLGMGAYYAAQSESHLYNFVLGHSREREPGKVEAR